MQPTYFASFLLNRYPEAPLPPIADGVEVIADWIFKNQYRPLQRPSTWPNLAEPFEYSNGTRIQALQLLDQSQRSEAFALRFEHPDQQSRHWRTDCVLTTVTDPEPAIRFSVSVAAGGASDSIYALRPPSSRPRLVRTMMDKFGAREAYPLASTFVNISDSEAGEFSGFLLDTSRTLPVVFVSRRNHDNGLPCNPSELAGKLAGIAYVCVAASNQVSWSLVSHIDNRLNAYDGTIRVYWPRMKRDDPPYRHRWWTRHQVQALGRPISDELLRLIATTSVTRHVPGLIRWEDVERENTRRTLHQLRSSSDVAAAVSDDWLRQYEIDIAALDAARQELASMSDTLLDREEEVRRWKQMYVQALRGHPTEADNVASEAPTIDDALSAIDAASKDYADQLEIINGRVSKEAAQFDEPELLYAALKWLATVYRDSKTGLQGCADLDKSCREACEFRYHGHQSEVTMGMFSSDYELTRNGATIKLKEHIGFGSSTEPRHTIRVAFFFDERTQKVVIGYIGQHQTTRRSN